MYTAIRIARVVRLGVPGEYDLEGNGRTQRAFGGQLAREAGHPMSWVLLGREANIAASKAAHEGGIERLRDLLDGLVARPKAGEDTVSG